MFWRKQGRALFRPYELAVLDAVLAALQPDARALVERQVAATRHVQRLYDDTSVSLYPGRGRVQRRDDALALANQALELRLATVALRGHAGTGTVVLSAVRGHLFELVFRPSPSRLGLRGGAEITGVTIDADAMTPDEGAAVEARLRGLDADLRTELDAAWAGESPLASFVVARDEVWTVDLDDGRHVVVAQLDDGTMIAARVDPPAPGVRLFDTDGVEGAVHGGLREAIEASTRSEASSG